MIYLAGKQVFKHNRIEFLEEMLKKENRVLLYKRQVFFSFFKKLIYILKSDIIYVLPM